MKRRPAARRAATRKRSSGQKPGSAKRGPPAGPESDPSLFSPLIPGTGLRVHCIEPGNLKEWYLHQTFRRRFGPVISTTPSPLPDAERKKEETRLLTATALQLAADMRLASQNIFEVFGPAHGYIENLS